MVEHLSDYRRHVHACTMYISDSARQGNKNVVDHSARLTESYRRNECLERSSSWAHEAGNKNMWPVSVRDITTDQRP